MRIVMILLCLALVVPALAQTTSTTSKGKDKGTTTSGEKGSGSGAAKAVTDFGVFSMKPPEEWAAVKVPHAGMRKAAYTLPAPKKGGKAGEMVVFYFGPSNAGGVQANLDRWKGRFEKPADMSEEDHCAITKKDVNGMTVHIIELRGTDKGSGMPGAKDEPQANHMMLGAIVETPQGAYYFRTLGHEKTLSHWKKAWYTMMLAIEPKKE